jgi:RNA polymerase sigma-70 factor (ECF subfamily)
MPPVTDSLSPPLFSVPSAVAAEGSPARVHAESGLLTAARAGDRDAMKRLYLDHATYIAGMCARLLRDSEEAREITQDTFARAFERLDQLRDDEAFRPWVACIAVRLVGRTLRKRRLFRLVGFGHDRDEEVDASLARLALAPTAESRAELERLDALLLRLPSEQRIAWMLRHVDQNPLEEVATMCDCSLATVKRRIDAAQTFLRREMNLGEP